MRLCLIMLDGASKVPSSPAAWGLLSIVPLLIGRGPRHLQSGGLHVWRSSEPGARAYLLRQRHCHRLGRSKLPVKCRLLPLPTPFPLPQPAGRRETNNSDDNILLSPPDCPSLHSLSRLVCLSVSCAPLFHLSKPCLTRRRPHFVPVLLHSDLRLAPATNTDFSLSFG